MSKRAKYDPVDYPVRDWSAKPEVEPTWRQETSRRFHDLMDNAMLVSFHKYGAVAEAYPEKVNALDSLRLRLDTYLHGNEAKGIKPGNAEYLVDVANFAMIEFMHPSIAAALIHTDADGSPGRVAANAAIYDTPNQIDNRGLADADERPFA